MKTLHDPSHRGELVRRMEALTPDSERHGVPGRLADRLFALDIGIDHVYVLQNTVTVRRPGGWDEDTAGLVSDVTSTFLRFYDEEE